MDTLVITPEIADLIPICVFPDGVVSQPLGDTVPLDCTIYIRCDISGTKTVNGNATTKYNRIGFNFGGIEWKLTAQDTTGDVPVPVPLSNKTYVDSYGKLHLGPEIEAGVEITIGARIVSPNPSGNGYTIDANSTSIKFGSISRVGNANANEYAPYITYQAGDARTLASGMPSLT